MTRLNDILRVGGELLDVEGALPWIEALTELSELWTEIAKKIRELNQDVSIDSIDSLLSYLLERLDEESVTAAFDTLGIPGLLEKLKSAKEKLANLPKPIGKLLRPVSDFAEDAKPIAENAVRPPAYREDWVDASADDGEIILPFGVFETKPAGEAGDVDLIAEVKAHAGLKVEAGATWPYSRDMVVDRLLEVAVSFELSAKAGGKVPYKFGTAAAQAESKLDAALMLYFKPKSGVTLYATALHRAMTACPNPFELQSVWDAMALDGMAGQVFAIDGYALGKVDVGFGKILDIPRVLSADLNMSLTIGFKRSAAYLVSARRARDPRTGNQIMKVAVSHDDAAASNWGAGAKIAFDLTPIFTKVHSILVEAVGEWDAQLIDLRPYLAPGTWLKEKAASIFKPELDNWIGVSAVRSAIAQDLGFIDTKGANEAALKELLLKAITEKVGGIAQLASGELEGLTDKALEDVVSWIPALNAEGIREELKAGIKAAVKKYQDDLNQKIKEIATKAPNGQVIKDAIASLGLKVDEQIDQVDQRVAGLKRFVEEFDKLLHRLVESAGDSANQKVGMDLSFASSRTTGTEMELVGAISEVTPQTSALWSAMMMGRFGVLQQLFEEPESVPQFAVDIEKSLLSRFSKKTSKTGFTFIGFGVELRASQLLLPMQLSSVMPMAISRLRPKASLPRIVAGPENPAASASLVHTI